jgi:ADP-heptose:LPS heptosyltransferase
MERQVLIVHPGTLGDVLLARPAMLALKEAYPSHMLGLIAGGDVAGLLHTGAEIHAAFPLEGGFLAGLLAGPASVPGLLRKWLSRCDVAVCWMTDPEGVLSTTLREVGVRHVIVRSPHSPTCRALHQTDRFLETVREVAGTSKAREAMNMSFPEEIRQQAQQRWASWRNGNRPVVVVHPGSGSVHKCSEPALLARLIDWLGDADAVPVVIGGPADDERVRLVVALCTKPPVVIQHLDLVSVAGLLSQARLFIGHDSGLTHLAAALHRPTVALFGPTDAARWAPRGSHVQILSGASCRCGGWEEVQNCREKPCLQILADDLIGACRGLLERVQHTVV